MTKNRKSKKKFKIWHVVLTVVLVALICVGVVAFKNLDNIRALYSTKNVTKEEIVVKQEENRIRTQEILDSITDAEITDLSEEVREKLKTGEVTKEESIDIILGKTTVEEVIEKKNSNGAEQENPSKENQEPNAQKDNGSEGKPQDEKVENTQTKEEIIAKIYLLRAEYLNAIDALIASGKATLKTIKPGEWTMSKKMSLINEFAARGEALEGSCDARMEELLGELEAELIRLGESTAPIGEIRSSYKEQKLLKKEEIFSMYYPD